MRLPSPQYLAGGIALQGSWREGERGRGRQREEEREREREIEREREKREREGKNKKRERVHKDRFAHRARALVLHQTAWAMVPPLCINLHETISMSKR